MNHSPFDALGLVNVPTEDLVRLLRHVHRGEMPCPPTIAELARFGLQHVAESLLGALRGLDEAAVKSVLIAVVAERRQTERLRERLAALELR